MNRTFAAGLQRFPFGSLRFGRRLDTIAVVVDIVTEPGVLGLMPTYAYRCGACEHQFDQMQRFADDPLRECPVCGGLVRRVIQPVGIVFKGSGWYITDSRKAAADAKTDKKTDGKADPKAEPVTAKGDAKGDAAEKTPASEPSKPKADAPDTTGAKAAAD